MYNFLIKKGQLVAFGLGLLITLIFLISVFSGVAEFDLLAEEKQGETSIFNPGISGAIVLVVVAAAAMLLFGLFQVFTNLRASLKGLIGLGILVVVFLIGYSTSGNDCNEEGMSAAACQLVGGGITTALALAGLAALAFVASEIRNFFK
jgi:magnesium-transporting ATPase (P-type)